MHADYLRHGPGVQNIQRKLFRLAEYLKVELRDAHTLITTRLHEHSEALQAQRDELETRLSEAADSSRAASAQAHGVMLELNEEVEQARAQATCVCTLLYRLLRSQWFGAAAAPSSPPGQAQCIAMPYQVLFEATCDRTCDTKLLCRWRRWCAAA